MRGRRVATALLVVTSLGVAALSAVTTLAQPAEGRSAKARTACDLLTSADIATVFPDAPLDPGPRVVPAPPGSNENFTRCEWDDDQASDGLELFAQTFLARHLTKQQKRLLSSVVPGSTARRLTRAELSGIGDKGLVEIQPDIAYATIGVLKGDDHFIVSVGYRGPGEVAQIPVGSMIALARLAAANV